MPSASCARTPSAGRRGPRSDPGRRPGWTGGGLARHGGRRRASGSEAAPVRGSDRLGRAPPRNDRGRRGGPGPCGVPAAARRLGRGAWIWPRPTRPQPAPASRATGGSWPDPEARSLPARQSPAGPVRSGAVARGAPKRPRRAPDRTARPPPSAPGEGARSKGRHSVGGAEVSNATAADFALVDGVEVASAGRRFLSSLPRPHRGHRCLILESRGGRCGGRVVAAR